MKHFIGQPNYSTYHSYTQAQARPINLPDLASAMGVYNNIRAYNSRAEAKAAADAAKAKAEAEAKEAAATQEAMNQSSMLQSDLQAQRNNVNAQYNAEAAAYANHMQQVVSADQELMNTQTIATEEPLQQRQSMPYGSPMFMDAVGAANNIVNLPAPTFQQSSPINDPLNGRTSRMTGSIDQSKVIGSPWYGMNMNGWNPTSGGRNPIGGF